VYEFVCGCPEPVGRDEADAAAGIGRAVAVYQLDKLVEAGLLTQAAENAAADFLSPLGVDLDREVRRATPARMARAYAEPFAPESFQLTTLG
jgi:hypothetical protein